MFHRAEQQGEEKTDQRNTSHDAVEGGGAVGLVEGTADERARTAAQPKLDRPAQGLRGGADPTGRALVDIGDTAGMNEGEAGAADEHIYEDQGGFLEGGSGSEPEHPHHKSEDHHPAGAKFILDAFGRGQSGDLSQQGNGQRCAHERGAAADVFDV